MVDVPAATPVTKPVEASIVATAGVALDQVPPGVASDNCVVEPTQTVKVPVIGSGAAGIGFTVILDELFQVVRSTVVAVTDAVLR
jgi:hypothetical protein